MWALLEQGQKKVSRGAELDGRNRPSMALSPPVGGTEGCTSHNDLRRSGHRGRSRLATIQTKPRIAQHARGSGAHQNINNPSSDTPRNTAARVTTKIA